MAGKVVSVTVNYGETVNMGNYESLRLDYGLTATVDDVQETEIFPLMHKLRTKLKAQLHIAIKAELDARS